MRRHARALARDMAGTRFTPTAFIRESEKLASTRWQVSRLADVGGGTPRRASGLPKAKSGFSGKSDDLSGHGRGGGCGVLIRKSALAFPLSLP